MRWKKDKVFSIELRDGTLAVLQMMNIKGRIAVLDVFSKTEDIADIKPSSLKVLFYAYILNDVLKRSIVKELKGGEPCQGLSFPSKLLSMGRGNRNLTLWKGEAEERIVRVCGEGEPLVVDTSNSFESYSIFDKQLEVATYDECAQFELKNLRCYPEFNERLYLCSKKKRNYDPLKEIAFTRPLDKDATVYIDIIGGKVQISDLGY